MHFDKNQINNTGPASGLIYNSSQGDIGSAAGQRSTLQHTETSVDCSPVISSVQGVAGCVNGSVQEMAEDQCETALASESPFPRDLTTSQQPWIEPSSMVFNWGLDYDAFAEYFGTSEYGDLFH